MHFCPCSCSKQDCESEEDVLICLPRNLSYAGESCLGRFSVSSAFVHTTKVETQMLQTEVAEQYLEDGASACAELLNDREGEQIGLLVCEMADSTQKDSADSAIIHTEPDTHLNATNTHGTPFLPPINIAMDSGECDLAPCGTKLESPDSDMVSEEGIFVNMMDDLDGIEGARGKGLLSEASDDTYVSEDSLYYSPEELEHVDNEEARGGLRVTLEEAVQQAAYSLQTTQPNTSKIQSETPVLSFAPLRSTRSSLELESKKAVLESKDTSTIKDSCFDLKGNEATTLETDSNKFTNGLKITINDRPFKYDDKGHLNSSYLHLVSPESPLFEDHEFNFTKAELRKSTSLKSSKTPPGTPRRKKVVRFADAMGLDLESVRHILNLESPPKIPPSAMKDLQTGLGDDRKEMGTKFFSETFQQPGADISFRDRVLVQKVILENALIVSGAITGVIRVANIGFHKAVHVRFTTNNWCTFHDIAASYMVNSNDGGTDRFSFTIVPPSDFMPGSKLLFAISYGVNGEDYWDNNYGNNYGFECYAKTIPTEAENAWMHFL